MISETRANAIDYFFRYDFRARRKCFLSASGGGFLVLFLTRAADWPDGNAFLFSLIVTLGIIFYHLATYRSREGVSLQGEMKQRTLATLWETNRILPDRRRAIWGIPIFAASVLLLAFIPIPTDGQIVNERIRRLIRAGHTKEATRLAQSAAEAGIPLSPDVIPVIGIPLELGRGGLQDWRRQPYHGPRAASVTVDVPVAIDIKLPVLSIPPGTYNIHLDELPLSFPNSAMSMAGAGPEQSVILLYGSGDFRRRAFLSYDSSDSSDVLIYGLTFSTGMLGGRSGLAPLALLPGAPKVVISDVVIDSLSQTIDRAIWSDVEFRNCAITLSGDAFRLREVKFLNCDFEFTEGVPPDVRGMILGHSGEPISVEFEPQ
jgi:hypothetical protein